MAISVFQKENWKNNFSLQILFGYFCAPKGKQKMIMVLTCWITNGAGVPVTSSSRTMVSNNAETLRHFSVLMMPQCWVLLEPLFRRRRSKAFLSLCWMTVLRPGKTVLDRYSVSDQCRADMTITYFLFKKPDTKRTTYERGGDFFTGGGGRKTIYTSSSA